jgi:archaemetzincin
MNGRIINIVNIIIVLVALSACNVKLETRQVALMPVGKCDPMCIKISREALKEQYDVAISVLPPTEMPTGAFVNIKAPRYRADSLIRFGQKIVPDTIDNIMLLTEQDISITKKDILGRTRLPRSKYEDWGVFGLAYHPGRSAVVSTYRLGGKTRLQWEERLRKIVVHEYGHNLGLPHCERESCVMRDAAESIRTIDEVGSGLCEQCKRKVK